MAFCPTEQRGSTRRPLHGLILLATFCALTACGGGSYSVVGPPNPPPEPPSPPPPPPAPEPEIQTVAGRDALRERILWAGGFRGMVVVHDWSEGPHAARMRDVLLEEHVPEDRIAVPDVTHVGNISVFLDTPEHADLISRTRVVAVPFTTPLGSAAEVDDILENDIVWVVSVGNFGSGIIGDTRDLWYPDHPRWNQPPASNSEDAWQNHLDAFDTGKVLLATYVVREEDGSYTEDPKIVRCGHAKDVCIAVPRPTPGTGGLSSSASARVTAMAYYVYQLVDNAEDVVTTLAACAEDAGEPGVDEEFGLGVVSLACEQIEDAEVRTATASLVAPWSSPALDRLRWTFPAPGFAFDAGVWFADRRGRPLGRLGGSYVLGRGEFAVSTGRELLPLGVASSLAPHRTGWYVDAAARWRVAGSAGGGLHAALSAGRAGGALSPRSSRAGLLYRRSGENLTWSVYGGHAWHRAAVGIPGHRGADRGRSRAAAAGWETSVAVRWRF